MAISEETAGHRATLRVLAILDALAANQKGLTMAEICRELRRAEKQLVSHPAHHGDHGVHRLRRRHHALLDWAGAPIC